MTTMNRDDGRKTLIDYLAGVLEGGSDGVGGDWSAEEAATAIRYEAEQWRKSQPSTDIELALPSGTKEGDLIMVLTKPLSTQPAPETGGEWRVVWDRNTSHPESYHIREHGNGDCIAHTSTEQHAAQIVADHNGRHAATEALKGVAIMLNTELQRYEQEPWAQRVRAALAAATEQGKEQG